MSGESAPLPVPSEVRRVNLTVFAAAEKIKPKKELNLCGSASMTMVMPVFNEEKFISETLTNIATTAKDEVEVLIVDNGSTDHTKDVVREFAQTSPTNISVMDYGEEKGPGAARRAGGHQVVCEYLMKHPDADVPHWISIMDADALLDPAYVKNHQSITTSDPRISVMGIVYRFPGWVDEAIQGASGIPDYFFSLSELARNLTKSGTAKIQTGTKGSAIEVATYGEVGGAPKTAKDEAGKPSEDRQIGENARARGKIIGFNPALNIHNPRRVVKEMSAGIPALQSYNEGDPSVSVYREDPKDLLSSALQKVNKDDLVHSHLDRLRSFVNRNMVLPVVHGQLARGPLIHLLEENNVHVGSLGESVNAITDMLIRIEPKLAAIHL